MNLQALAACLCSQCVATVKAAVSHRDDPSCQSTTAVWPHSIFSSALTIVLAHTFAKTCQEPLCFLFFFKLFFKILKWNHLVHHSILAPFLMKQNVFFFSFFIYFFCHKVWDKLLTFWLVCLLSNSCSSWLVFNMLRVVIYACVHACVRLYDCVSVRVCAFICLLLLMLLL